MWNSFIYTPSTGANSFCESASYINSLLKWLLNIGYLQSCHGVVDTYVYKPLCHYQSRYKLWEDSPAAFVLNRLQAPPPVGTVHESPQWNTWLHLLTEKTITYCNCGFSRCDAGMYSMTHTPSLCTGVKFLDIQCEGIEGAWGSAALYSQERG